MFPGDKKNLVCLMKQSRESRDIFNRKNFIGHIVANALVINSNNNVLRIFHNGLKMYIQPGGHVESGDKSVIDATNRELIEETGINDSQSDGWHKKTNIPILIESHLIPKNVQKEEAEHYHHDFMYIFRTNTDDISLQLEEVSNFQWTDIAKILEEDPTSFIGKSLLRMLDLGIIKE